MFQGIELEEQDEDEHEALQHIRPQGKRQATGNIPEHILNSSLELDDDSDTDSSVVSELSNQERDLNPETDTESGSQSQQLRLDLETNSESDSQSETGFELGSQSKHGRHLDLESGSDSDSAELRYLQNLRETIRHRSRRLSRSSQSSRSSRPGTSTRPGLESDIELGNDGDSEGIIFYQHYSP